MGTKIRTSTTYTYETDEHTFPIPWVFCDDSELLKISANGLKAVLWSLSDDSDSEDPLSKNEGDFYQFDRDYIHYSERPEPENFKRIIRANPGRVFTTTWAGDCHGPGTVNIKINVGPFSVVDTKNGYQGHDYSKCERDIDDAGGYYIAPEDVTDPLKYAEGAMKEFSSWCNGDVYGVCVWIYERESIEDSWPDPDRDNECWGYYGADNAEEVLKEEFEGMGL